jgi:hypothetical protein
MKPLVSLVYLIWFARIASQTYFIMHQFSVIQGKLVQTNEGIQNINILQFIIYWPTFLFNARILETTWVVSLDYSVRKHSSLTPTLLFTRIGNPTTI